MFLPLPLIATLVALPPTQTIAIPPSCGETVLSVAWAADDTVLLGSMSGVTRFRLSAKTCTAFIDGALPPDGLKAVYSVATDDRTAIAMGVPAGTYAARLSDGIRIFGQQSGGFLVSDVAITGTSIFLLAQRIRPPLATTPLPAVWRGNASADWSTMTPIHRLASDEAASIFRHSVPPQTGAIALGPDRTIYAVTAAEPGVFHYRHDGTLIAHLAPNLRELVVTRMPEVYRDYAQDVRGRYVQILNKQPTINDLVVTDDGPAIVVRIAEGDVIHWELWYPDAKGVKERIRLTSTRPGPSGMIRCDARGRRLVCVIDEPNGSSPFRGPASLVLFDLPPKKRAASPLPAGCSD